MVRLALNLISSADVSADHLSITFHLKQPYVPFLSLLGGWLSGPATSAPFQHDGARGTSQVAG